MSSSSNFKVIVVGGGPVGLTAAHALTQAGIDFVVLESRHSVVIDAGSNLVLLPMGMRLLGQLGLLPALDAVSSPLSEIERFDHKGREIGKAQFFVYSKENHGVSPRVISRHSLTEVLYNTLPAKSQASMYANKRVADIATTADGVVVTCRDGSSYEGSVVIGADGAHSLIRERMRALALAAAETDVNEEKPFLTTYRAMWVRFPTSADLRPGNAMETHGTDCAVQLFAGEETSVIGVYERVAEGPTRERSRYGPADEEAFIGRWGHLPISRELTLRDAYEGRVQDGVGMVSLEEGVVKHWSYDRVVLVGDAAHKFTPSTGAGCNNGIVDIAVLISELNAAVQEAGAQAPTRAQIGAAFQRYQDARVMAVTKGCAGAAQATAAATWRNSVTKFVDQYILSSSRVQKLFMNQSAAAVARTPVLDFIQDVKPATSGKVAWVDPVPRAVKA